MIPAFDFATVGQIVFGAGARARLGACARPLGRRALVVTGRTPARAAWAFDELEKADVATTAIVVSGEPSVAVVEQGASVARAQGCEVVVAVGGGSVMDAGKAIAAIATNEGAVLDYLEVVGQGRPLSRPPLPSIAVPTTAGTGSEATRNAVLTVPDARVKVSLRSPWMLPKIAIVDPDLTRDLPPLLTATTGLDALTQLIEAYVSARATPMTDPLCTEGIRLSAGSLRAAVSDGGQTEARSAMSLASLWSGIALANAGLGAVHGLAGPIGGMFDAPHGAVCAALLPHVCAANVRACREVIHSASDALVAGRATRTLERFANVAKLLTGDATASPDCGVEWLAELVRDLKIPGLVTYGLAVEDAAAVAAQAQRSSSMRGNPVTLSSEALSLVILQAR